jgi:hypothetical protein
MDEPVAPAPPSYWLTRWLYLRGIGFIYLCAFISLWWQLVPLLGARGVLPAASYLAALRHAKVGFADVPSLFWLGCSDGALRVACAVGLALSAAVLAGLTNALAMAALWILYLSFVHVGQLFYGYGWEILLLEAGFLAIFFCPLRSLSPLPAGSPPPAVMVWLVRWLLFRVMFGAGLIKIRGDECWRDLTCLIYHYETQPIPNPLSWLLHQAPPWFHKLGVLYNHFVELIAPFLLFWPRRLAMAAGLATILFQTILISSGNLSWLNWLTLTLCVACFDDQALARLAPARARAQLAALAGKRPTRLARGAGWALCALVAGLSMAPVANLVSEHQVMNTSFDRLHLVNTYGAFGSVGRVRNEVVLEGSYDGVEWREYQFKCKPGDPARRPCVIAPLQLRLDWQIWFAAMSRIERQPWLLHLVARLLDGDAGALGLLGPSPFDRGPPRYIRARLYEYHFTRFGEPGWWTRKLVGEYMPPLGRDQLRELLAGATDDDDI